jgi:hypothetical protein
MIFQWAGISMKVSAAGIADLFLGIFCKGIALTNSIDFFKMERNSPWLSFVGCLDRRNCNSVDGEIAEEGYKPSNTGYER